MQTKRINTKAKVKKLIDIVGEKEIEQYLNEVAEWLVEDQTFTFSTIKGSEIKKHEWLLDKTNEYLKKGGKGEFTFINELSGKEDREDIANLLKIIGVKKVNSAIKAIKKYRDKLNISNKCRSICISKNLKDLQNLLTDLNNHKANANKHDFKIKKSNNKATEHAINALLKKYKIENIIKEITKIKKNEIAHEVSRVIFAQEDSKEFIDLKSFAKVQKKFSELTNSQELEK